VLEEEVEDEEDSEKEGSANFWRLLLLSFKGVVGSATSAVTRQSSEGNEKCIAGFFISSNPSVCHTVIVPRMTSIT
jgi:hypothetical protein